MAERTSFSKSPQGYRQYVRLCVANSEKPLPEYARFASRFELSSQIETISIHGYSAQSSAAYTELLRLSLAYSAIEVFNNIPAEAKIRSIKNLGCAKAFKSVKLAGLRDFLISNSGTKLRSRLNKLVSSVNDSDVLPVIESIRHCMFHGVLNPHRAKISSKASLEFIEELGFAAFTVMNNHSRVISDELSRKFTAVQTENPDNK